MSSTSDPAQKDEELSRKERKRRKRQALEAWCNINIAVSCVSNGFITAFSQHLPRLSIYLLTVAAAARLESRVVTESRGGAWGGVGCLWGGWLVFTSPAPGSWRGLDAKTRQKVKRVFFSSTFIYFSGMKKTDMLAASSLLFVFCVLSFKNVLWKITSGMVCGGFRDSSPSWGTWPLLMWSLS